jgi:hypothetical protein
MQWGTKLKLSLVAVGVALVAISLLVIELIHRCL